jgi:lipopolysaccharide biosynthesis glycosyltransferase
MNFKTGYGVFTGGQKLADAAYYRIYLARLLARENSYDRAIYIDSDTVVFPGVERMLWADTDQPLMARLDGDRPETRAAIAAHKLPKGTYFNSGVLVFDLRDSHLEECLQRTIDATTDPNISLLFHDQCALNIGFSGHFVPLEGEYNRFVRPHDKKVSGGVIMHFLERPKPWDPAYPLSVCRIWYRYWDRLAKCIGPEEAMRLYRLANAE